MTPRDPHSIKVGKYLVTPFTRSTSAGEYIALLSIRSGRGSASHDRIYRFVGRFTTPEAARQHALAQGSSWLATPLH
jgi:hypothetical protein